jgi:predicted acylesterase/phospholipase RssA/CRP-like cAMP-binding protein
VIKGIELPDNPQVTEHSFIGELSESDRSVLLSRAQEYKCLTNDFLIRAGDPGDRIFLILEGRISIEGKTQPGKPRIPQHAVPGELLGMLAFFSAGTNEADLRCLEDSRFAVMSRSAFDALLGEAPDLWRRLQKLGLARMRKLQLANHLDRLFGPFGVMLPFVLNDLEDEIAWITLQSGMTLYQQGDEATGAYILMAGRLQMVTQSTDYREVVNSTVLAGETVGEVALLTGKPQAQTVYAARDSELALLSKYSFELMLQRNTRAIHNVSKILGERLANSPVARDPARMPIRCISLVPASSNIELASLAQGLERELRVYGSTLLIDSQVVESELGAPAIAQAGENEAAGLRLNEWLHKQESALRYLVYQADQQWTAWSARCVRQTDQVVVVADAAAESDLDDIEKRLSGPRQQWSLVLLHPAGLDRPRNTARWLRNGNMTAVLHVRRQNREDLARLARILTGNAVSLVLGGGGARGFAHLGVLRALEELDIPIDMVGGTSMGAPIAGFVAQGSSGTDVGTRASAAYHGIIDFTLPLVSLIAGKRISASIKKQTGDWDIEDFWLPFFCVSTSLTTALPVVHRRGNSWLAIRSSVSIPGVLPPMPSNGELLVDGGVLNNLPVDIMREMNPFGTVIAIDVVPPIGPGALSDYGTEISGWRLLMNRLLPWQKASAVPGIAAIILQSMVAGSALKRQQILEQQLADVYLNINVEGVGLLQFDAQNRAAQIGYDAVIEPLRSFAAKFRAMQGENENGYEGLDLDVV